jgi:hypothetical protein
VLNLRFHPLSAALHRAADATSNPCPLAVTGNPIAVLGDAGNGRTTSGYTELANAAQLSFDDLQ